MPWRFFKRNVWRGDSTPAVLKLLPGSSIKDGAPLRVSWYHPLLIQDSQVVVCMAEPEVYDANNLDDVKHWMTMAKPFSNVRDFMYTPWTGNYDLLPAFGDLFSQ